MSPSSGPAFAVLTNQIVAAGLFCPRKAQRARVRLDPRVWVPEVKVAEMLEEQAIELLNAHWSASA